MTVVVTDSDIRRIKSTLLLPKAKASGGAHDEPSSNQALQRKKLSDKRVEGWKDTLAAKRKERLLWKSKKLEEEEEQRKALDREEAESRAQKRTATLRRAEDLLYEQNDKVKAFRSQQLYVDVIADREKQILERREIEKAARKEEEKWH